MRLIPRAAMAAAALSMLITACSSASPSGSPTASTDALAPSSQATSASPTAANPDAGLFSGTQLAAMLAPAAKFPSGFAFDSSGSLNTGDTYQPATPPGKFPCSRLGGTAWIDLTDIGAVSFAQSDYIDKTKVEEYAQEIDEFPGGTALTVMAALRKLPARCATYKDPQTGSTVTVKLGKGPALGDGSLSIFLTDPNWQGGTTLEAVRIGTAVITVFYSASSGTGAKQATQLASVVTGRVRQKSRTGSS